MESPIYETPKWFFLGSHGNLRETNCPSWRCRCWVTLVGRIRGYQPPKKSGKITAYSWVWKICFKMSQILIHNSSDKLEIAFSWWLFCTNIMAASPWRIPSCENLRIPLCIHQVELGQLLGWEGSFWVIYIYVYIYIYIYIGQSR